MKKIYTQILIFAMLLIPVVTVKAQDSRGVSNKKIEAQKRIALVIGNGDYQHTGKLDNPVNDATDMTKALESLGFEVVSGTNQTKRGMEDLIRDFGRKLAGQGGVGLFYYAGHGVQVSGQNYLVPVDAVMAEEDEVQYAGVSMGFVLSKMDSAKNSLNMIILDACRNNPFARSWRNFRDAGENKGLAKITPPTGTLVLYATQPGNVAADGTGRNGLFTSALLNQMKKPNVEYDQMIKEVAREVNRKSNGKQLPWKEGISLNDFYFGGRGGKGKVQTTPPVANVPIKNKTVRKPGTLMPTNKYGMEFVYIPEGEFLMGSTETEVSEALSAFRKYFDNAPESWVRSEYPQHWVKISRSFEMMRYEVTQGQWEKVMRTTVRQQRDKSNPKLPMYSEGINYPMYYVSWDETQEFIKRLNEQRDGYSYRLPTEAEWEYAARAGTTSRYYWGNDTDETEVCRYANLADQTAKEENPKIKTMTCRDGFADLAPVGSFASNSWGLYDMSGNVWEWVKDWYSKDYYGRSSLTDPGGPKSGSNRVRRGGSWSVVASSLRSANRLGYSPDVRRSRLGFRLVRTLN